MNSIYNKKKSIFSRNTVYLLAILNFVFIAYYVMLAFYSRFHYDDLHFLCKMKEMNPIEFASDFYFSRSGRFASYFKVGFYSEMIILLNEHRFLPILLWAVGVGMCWYVVKSLFKGTSNFIVLNVVMVFYNIYVLSNIDFAVFNWLCAMDYYLLAPMLLFTLTLLNKTKLSIVEWILLFISALLFGGGQEAFTPIVLATLFFNGLFYLHSYNCNLKDVFLDSRVKRIFVISIFILVCFIIVLIAPGNYSRINMPEFVSPTSLYGYIIGYADALRIFSYQFSFYLPYYALLAVLFVLLGNHFYVSSFKIRVPYRSLVIYSTISYAVYVLLTIFPIVYLWSGFGIQRNYTPMVFFTMLFIMFHAFLFGYFKSSSCHLRVLKSFLNIGLLAFIFIMSYNFYSDRISAKNYADSVDDRLAYLKSLQANGRTEGVVEVDPISVPYTNGPKYLFYNLIGRHKNPHPVLYYISDTDTVPNEYSMHYCKYYGFGFQIKLKESNVQY